MTNEQIQKGINLFNKLNIPREYHTPKQIKNGYSLILSDRSRGKTTNYLLFYMCVAYVNNKYGTYIRNRKTMITMSKMTELFNVINEFDYVSIITNKKYNCVKYDKMQRTFHYANNDNKEEWSEPFLYVLSIDNSEDYKSTLNLPRCIYSIFDEFINYSHFDNEFVQFLDLLKTIYRERVDCYIAMLANTINLDDDYIHEFNIYNQVKFMRFGDKKTITSEKGTNIYIEILPQVEETAKKKRNAINKLLFGFNNPKLISITGEDDTWNIKNYRHIEHTENDYILDTRFINHYNNIMRVDLIRNDVEVVVHCYPFNYVSNNSTVLTNMNDYNVNAFCNLRDTKLNHLYVKLYKFNKWQFANNEVGAMVESTFSKFGIKYPTLN